MNCDPNSLLQAARCFKCIPAGMMEAVRTRILCDWPDGSIPIPCDDPVVVDWVNRIEAGGATRPSDATIIAVCDFCTTLRTVGIMDEMIMVNVVIPDSFDAMLYPLIYQPGNGLSPWTNVNFVPGDLTVNGLQGGGPATGTYLNTGWIPQTQWGPLGNDSGGISCYSNLDTGETEFNMIDFGCATGVPNTGFFLSNYEPGSAEAYGVCWTIPVNSAFGAEVPGFFSMNRVATNDLRLFFGNEAVGWFGEASNNLLNDGGAGVVSVPAYFMALNNSGVVQDWTRNRDCFIAVHEGMGALDVEQLYLALRTLRIALGGGLYP